MMKKRIGRGLFIRSTREGVKDETDITNEWNSTLQAFGDQINPKVIKKLKVVVFIWVYA